VVLLGALIASAFILTGAAVGGAPGTIYGMAAGACIGVGMFWVQFRKAFHEYKHPPAEGNYRRMRNGRHRHVKNSAAVH
jgi:hypothetical protein